MASISFLYGSCYTHDSGWTEDKNWSSGDNLYLSTEGNSDGANNLITLQLDAQPSEAITTITVKVAVKRHNLLVHRLSVTGYLYLDSQKPTDANVPSGYIASSTSGTIYPSSVVVVGAEMTFSNLNIPGDTKYVYVKCYSDEDELNYIEMDHRNNNVSCASAQRYCSLTYNINCQGGGNPAHATVYNLWRNYRC